MTTNTSKTVSLRNLTEDIRRHERSMAYGSETALWGEYCERMEQITGHLPYDDYSGDPQVPADEAGWWMAAYAYAEANPECDRDDWVAAGDRA